MAYPDIEAHGVIGNTRTTALVCTNGSIDFFCFPNFDSPSVFLALLDDRKGGHFTVSSRGDVRTRQMYLPDTNVLVTRFMSPDGLAEVTDFMPVGPGGPQNALVRRVKGIRGGLTVCVHCGPRFDYARTVPRVRLSSEGRLAEFMVGDEVGPLRLRATETLTAGEGCVTLERVLKPGEEIGLVFECAEERPSEGPLERFLQQSFDETVRYWRSWSGRSNYRGRWREVVQRSALILKLLSSSEHGSIIGAATFGLPERIGGSRNWDYRYCWIRDAAFTVYALMRLGYFDEATAFIRWVEDRSSERDDGERLQILYGPDGRHDVPEEVLDHLDGYRGSRPVRVGNAAAMQLQLDIYGELVDAVYLSDKHIQPFGIDNWLRVVSGLAWVCDNWNQPDEGIWEVRGERREFLSGRLMCWVALDRGLRMAGRLARPAPVDRWRAVRDEIAATIFDDFWNEELGAFVQYRGGRTLDAAAMLMPLVKFVSPVDRRWLSTLDVIGRELASDALVQRYITLDDGENVDGLDGEEGAFTACSFWYVECLARAGRVEEAQLLFEKLIGYANHLGLYSEELGTSGEHLGNFPQAWTHLALISAAYALDHAIAA